jgi:lysophospholipase L1-like esterase
VNSRRAILACVNVAVLCAMLVGAEVVGQIAYFVTHGHLLAQEPYWDNDVVFELHPYLVGAPKKNLTSEADGVVVSTTKLGTRVTGATEDAEGITVAVLGGSSAFGTRVGNEDSWPAQLQRSLGTSYTVYNYGVPGYSTAEGIIQLALLVPEVAPRVVVFYEGWNDIRNYHQDGSPDYFLHGMKQYGNLGLHGGMGQNQEPLMARLGRVSALIRVVNRVAAKLPAPAQVPVDSAAASAAPDSVVDRLYLRNLKTLKTLAESQGAIAIFVPQLLNDSWYETHPGAEAWTPGILNSAMPSLMTRLNGIMEQVCPSDDHSCYVLKEAPRIGWDSTDFMDEGHLSRKGGAKLAGLVAATIVAAVGGAASASH